MNISFDGIGEVIATFGAEDITKLAVGDVVVMTDDSQVGLGAEGGQLCGVVVTVAEDGYTGVQIDGLAQVNYTGTSAPAVGWELLATDGAGNVKVAESDGVACLVVAVDTVAKTAVIKL